MISTKAISVEEIQNHSTRDNCWVVIDGKVWDLTEFAPEHPGGAQIIWKYAGRDGTEEYNAIHAPSLLSETLSASKLVGTLDVSTAARDWSGPEQAQTPRSALASVDRPPLSTLINSYDFEEVASRTASKKTWAFYSSAATDLITLGANKSFFDQIWFRPRVLRNVETVSTRTRILGCNTNVPFFVAPAAMAKLVHPDGEKALAAGCSAKGVAQCISTMASFPLKEIAADVSHPLFFQLYVDKARKKSEALIHTCHRVGVKAIFVTVDTPMAGKREADERVRVDESISVPMGGANARNDKKGGGLARTTGGFIDASLSWQDLKWLRAITHLPIILKGIQTAADAKLAVEHGVQGIVLSNHGGRNLDTSPPAILVLLELQKCCPEVFGKLEVYVDGGIRRGTDVLKALCLGATAVGLGRPFLYALNYGREGVEHLINILQDELATAMRMLGITDLSQAHPGLVNTLQLDPIVPGTDSHPYAQRGPPPQAKL